MHFSTTSLLAVLTASFASATQMQINYYKDACQNYAGQVNVNWATKLHGGPNNCYNYHFAQWANVANCFENSCTCIFYSQSNCQGGALTQSSNGGQNCVAVQNAQSFACYYT
ncbi:hypothetical protein CI102_11391 [Trichoderma harzianum]|uniref:Small secreted protein n=1 Tax=Trichoderma harzianum CBS 226.95 TaxID=983964 RepID=A0A2T3ZVH9_TRIHA|nr:hypothetical protein M431DRAFT_98997 [Trichoderma harzianum CBS 226.95]PKK44423.1 hypothetical protein CI102_11391 [Trichoderma harzianum]PTB48820.1 hypothetical protein M431DRAFT_98997 [Trichoderma harzianum CBS 226.95]